MDDGAPAAEDPLPDEPSSDEALMLAYQRGETAAFDELVRRYHAPLFGFLVRVTHSRQQAEDAYSEALLRVVRAKDRYESRQTFRSWLFTIGRNCAADARRSRGRWLRLVSAARVEPSRAPAAPADARLDGFEGASIVDDALRALPEEHRSAVLLRYRYDLDHHEVAAALGLTERQVRDRLSYARRRLRDLLEPEREGPSRV